MNFLAKSGASGTLLNDDISLRSSALVIKSADMSILNFLDKSIILSLDNVLNLWTYSSIDVTPSSSLILWLRWPVLISISPMSSSFLLRAIVLNDSSLSITAVDFTSPNIFILPLPCPGAWNPIPCTLALPSESTDIFCRLKLEYLSGTTTCVPSGVIAIESFLRNSAL